MSNLDNLQLNIKPLLGGNKTPFYPKTVWNAIIDAPDKEGSNGKFLGIKDNELQFVDVETIKYIEFPTSTSCNTTIGQILNYINEGYNIIGKLTGNTDILCVLSEVTNNSVTFTYHKHFNDKEYVGIIKGTRYATNDDWQSLSFPLLEGPYDNGYEGQVLTYVEEGITEWKDLPESSSTLIIHTNEDGTRLDKSFQEIYNALQQNNNIVLLAKVFGIEVYCNIVAYSENTIWFSLHLATEEIHLDGAYVLNDNEEVYVSAWVPSWNEIQNKPNFAAVAITGSYDDLSNKPLIPTALSQLTNDSNFITNTVNNLTNYYKKSDTYTQAEVNNLIGTIQQFHYEIVSTLPTTGATNVLYLKGPIGTGTDKYEEYVYSNNTFVKIGDTSIDLSGYVKESDFDEYSQQDIINLMNSVL